MVMGKVYTATPLMRPQFRASLFKYVLNLPLTSDHLSQGVVINNGEESGGGGASEVLPLQKGGGGGEQKKNWGSF